MKQSTAPVVAGSVALAGVALVIGAQFVHPPSSCAASPSAVGVILAAAEAGHYEFVDVRVAGHPADVVDVVLCTSAGCSRPTDVTPAPTATPGLGAGLNVTDEKLDATEWRFIERGFPPSAVTLTAVDPVGGALATRSAVAHWTTLPRPSCGASSEPAAKPIVLAVPAGS